MNRQLKELRQLRGIGEVLSQRLVESSYDHCQGGRCRRKGVGENRRHESTEGSLDPNPGQEDDRGSRETTTHLAAGPTQGLGELRR